MQKMNAEILLQAYATGYFPMAESRDSPELMWFSPELRGVIPLDGFHIPAKLDRLVKKNPFVVTADKAFPEVIRACAEREEDTWINDEIITLYCELAERGFAHSIECWAEEKLVGGLYGVAIGGAYFGESMFSRMPNASKVALVHLVQRLKDAGYALLDTQYVNDHLMQFGVIEIPRGQYLEKLANAVNITPQNAFT